MRTALLMEAQTYCAVESHGFMIPERVPHPLDRVETLNRVVKVANFVRDLDSVLEILMDHLIELFGAEQDAMPIKEFGLRSVICAPLLGEDGLQRPADALRRAAPQYSEQLEAVLSKMLAMEPDACYARVEDAFEAFQAALG